MMALEAPPTAGLPVFFTDLWAGGSSDLAGMLGRFLGVSSVQVECSGTAALVVALTTLHTLAPERTEVIVPAYTCPLVAMAVAHCGLRLRMCELIPNALDMDPEILATLCGPRTLAVLPTHLAGRVVDAAPARALAHAAGAWVIEDAAQALGARVEGASVGTGSDIVFFSLAVGKGLSIFEGGALVVADADLRAACERTARAIVRPSFVWELRRSIELLAYTALYHPRGLRWAYGWPLRRALAHNDRIAAAGDDFSQNIPLHRVGRWRQAVGVRALARLPAWLEDSESRAQQRVPRLRGISSLTVLDDSAGVPAPQGTWPSILILLPDAARRDIALARLWGAGLGVSVPFAHVLADYVRYANVVLATDSADLPHARSFAARVLSISNSPWLDAEGFERLCTALEQVLDVG